jgi:enoyl-CoA hydratase/carnithine racemase
MTGDTRAASTPFRGEALALEWPESDVAVVTFTRPDEMNTLSLALLSELGHALDEVERARAAALVITGTGRAFCAGADLELFTASPSPIGATPLERRDRYIGPIAALFDRFEEMPYPIIAAINGYALGGGCEMVLSADIRLMASAAVLGLPEVKLGAIPGAGGVQKLIRHVGRSRALDWILLARHVTADEALGAGLLHAVTGPEQLVARALDLARGFRACGPAAVAQAKASIYAAEDIDLRSARRLGVEALTALMGTEEWAEGVAAFVEKRTPRFRG